MNPLTGGLFLAAQIISPTIVALETAPVARGITFTVTVNPELAGVTIREALPELRLILEGSAPIAVSTPAGARGLEAVILERGEGTVTLRLRLARGAAYHLSRTHDSLSLLIDDPPPAAALAGDESPPPVEELFPLLFPAGLPTEEEAEQVVERDEEEEEGLRLGFLAVRPGLLASYVDAESTFLSTPEPARTRFFQIEPRLETTASIRIGNGRLTARYQPTFRRGSEFEIVNQTSHAVDATLEMPLTPVSIFDAGYRFLRGTLEAREVDPGGELFFGLGRFTHHGGTAGLLLETGSRTAIHLGGFFDDVAIDDPLVVEEEGTRGRTAFFSYQRFGADAELRYELAPDLDAIFGYAYDEVPEPETRAPARSRAHVVFTGVQGELAFLTTGEARVGYRSQRNENVAAEGGSYGGLDLRASIRREFSRASSLQLMATRTTYPSAYELDGFYIATRAELRLVLPLPLAFVFNGAAGWQVNDYRVASPSLGEPREDRLFGWTLGVTRPLSRQAFLRVDYRDDRRRSNIDAFDIDTEALTIQLGVGLFGPPGR